MTVTTKGYITKAELYLALPLDISKIVTVATVPVRVYSDDDVDETILRAERKVNAFCKRSFSGTIPDAVQESTLTIAKKLIVNILIRDGFYEGDLYDEDKLFTDEIIDNLIEYRNSSKFNYIPIGETSTGDAFDNYDY